MKTYVIQIATTTECETEICQANNVTEALRFVVKKRPIGHIEYIYSEEYIDENTNEKNTHNNR